MNWNFLNQQRVKDGPYASKPEDGFNGMFRIQQCGQGKCGALRCIASNGCGWEHVSVSYEDGRTPDWKTMCLVRDLFWPPDVWVVQFHPPKSEYVNIAKNCLHLWRPTTATMPTPDIILVGIKESEFETAKQSVKDRLELVSSIMNPASR